MKKTPVPPFLSSLRSGRPGPVTFWTRRGRSPSEARERRPRRVTLRSRTRPVRIVPDRYGAHPLPFSRGPLFPLAPPHSLPLHGGRFPPPRPAPAPPTLRSSLPSLGQSTSSRAVIPEGAACPRGIRFFRRGDNPPRSAPILQREQPRVGVATTGSARPEGASLLYRTGDTGQGAGR